MPLAMPAIIGASSQKRSGRPFIIKVNYASGFTVTLPLYNAAGYNYNFIVDWGDGAVGQVTSATDSDRIHTYASGGTYTITMTGTLEGWEGNKAGLKEYIVEVTQWGRTGFKWVSMNNCARLLACYGKLITSQTNFGGMFASCAIMTTCEVDDWDVSAVTNFGGYVSGMFSYCYALTSLNCTNWRFSTTSDIYFGGTFWNCRELTTIGDTSEWNTEKFTDLRGTFYECRKLQAVDVSGWDVSNCINFGESTNERMFYNCQSLTSLDCSNWTFKTSGSIKMYGTFANCSNLTTIGDTSGWNTERVINFGGFCTNCVKLTSIDLTNFDFSVCTTVSGMFNNCQSLTSVGDLSDKNFSVCTDFGNYVYGMFYNCQSLTSLDCSGWIFNTSANIGFGGVFRNCTKLTTIGDVTGWNTSKFRSLDSTFMGCYVLTGIDISTWDVSNVIDFGNSANTGFMADCREITSLDLSGWTFNTVTNILLDYSFYRCSKLTTIGDTSGWNTEKFYEMSATFAGCSLLTSMDASTWNLANCRYLNGTWANCRSLTTLGDISDWNLSSCTTFGSYVGGTFYNCSSLTSLDCSGWTLNTTSNITGFSMFNGCTKLTTIGDVSGWNTSKVKEMGCTFQNCRLLTSVDVSTWDVSGVTNFGKDANEGMFQYCYVLTSLDLSGWVLNSTANITMAHTFNQCNALTTIGDISGWSPSKVTTFLNCFMSCSSLTSLNCVNWNVSNCTVFQSMFNGCTSLTSLDVSGWALNTTSNVNMYAMFYNCQSLTSLSFTGWNTSKVTNFQQFLDGSYALATCDVSVLNTSACTNVSYMFRNCRSMTSIDISGWDLSLVTAANMTQYMFYGCYGLTSLTLPSSLSRVDNQFAVFGGSPPAITVYNINRSAAPTVSGTPFGGYAKPLHVPVSNSGYNVSPWTNTAIFSSIIADL